MKCVCGYEDLPDRTEEVPVYFKTGKRKGQVSRIDKVVHKSEKFLEIFIGSGELSFRLSPDRDSWRYDGSGQRIELYACPKCSTIRTGNLF